LLDPDENVMSLLDRRTQLLLSAAAVVVIVNGMREAAGVLDPLLMAAVLVCCAVPLQDGLRQRGMPKGLALTLTALAVVGGTLAFGGIIGYAAKALVQTVPQYQDRLSELLKSGTAWLDARGIDASTSQLAALISPARLISLSTSLLSRVGSAFSLTLLIVMLAIFLLIESNSFMHRVGERAGAKAFSRDTQRTLNAIARDVQQYVWITLITGVMYAVGVWVLLAALGVDLPVLWAIFALVLSFVPGIGFVLSMIPPVALALLEFGVGRAVIIAVVLTVLNNVVDNVIKPRFMKEGFDLGPFVLFAAILFWSYVLGPTGALLAVPLTTAVRRLVFDTSPDVVTSTTATSASA
jgi:AI-2 transport protein TqsA